MLFICFVLALVGRAFSIKILCTTHIIKCPEKKPILGRGDVFVHNIIQTRVTYTRKSNVPGQMCAVHDVYVTRFFV